MIGFLWCLLERDSLLLLEEPELSLNEAVVGRIAPMISRAQRIRKRQVIVSTHSDALLADKGIGAEEVLLLTPNAEGTDVKVAGDIGEVVALLEGGMSVAEAVLPMTRPDNLSKLSSFAAD